MRVKSCAASDGAGHIIKLSDEFGCVLRPKMISKFLKARAPDERATVITYAFFHAFKFPDALSVHIKCKVEICRHGCLDHCQTSGVPAGLSKSGGGGDGGAHEGLLDRKDTLIEPSENEQLDNLLSEDEDDHDHGHHDIFYDDIIHKQRLESRPPAPVHQHDVESDMEDIESLFLRNKSIRPSYAPPQHHQHPSQPPMMKIQQQQHSPPPKPQRHPPSLPAPQKMQSKMDEEKFPHGPRNMQYAQNRLGLPIAGPRALDLDEFERSTSISQQRTKRSVKVTNRNARSADVGVNGFYDVISEADLQFSPDSKQEPVTVFQGKITEEVVYGICMPVQGFSILFILVISATIIAALVAGSLLYRYQLQKDALAVQQAHQSVSAPMNTLTNWMTMRLFRMKHPQMSNLSEATPSSSRQMESRQ
jgi:hypothetical protein